MAILCLLVAASGQKMAAVLTVGMTANLPLYRRIAIPTTAAVARASTASPTYESTRRRCLRTSRFDSLADSPIIFCPIRGILRDECFAQTTGTTTVPVLVVGLGFLEPLDEPA